MSGRPAATTTTWGLQCLLLLLQYWLSFHRGRSRGKSPRPNRSPRLAGARGSPPSVPYSQMRAILCSIRPLPSFDDDLKWIWVHTPSTSKKYRPVTSLRHSSTVSQNWLERRRRWDARKNHKWRLQLDTGRRDGRGKRERERLQSSQPELRSTERPTEPTPSDQPTNQQSKCIAPYSVHTCMVSLALNKRLGVPRGADVYMYSSFLALGWRVRRSRVANDRGEGVR